MRVRLVFLALLASALPAAAQTSGCSGLKWAVDREQTAFAGPDIPTVAGGAQLPGLAKAATVQLSAQGGLTYPVPPTHKPRNTPAYGGAFPLAPLTAPGTYQVTISDAAWVDVVQDGKLLKPTGFTDGKDCRGVRKSLRFALAAGPATIQISDAAAESMKLEVLPSQP